MSDQIAEIFDSFSPDDYLDRFIRVAKSYARIVRRGRVVVALSGGVDSSVTLRLACAAFGSERVAALYLPDRHTDTDTHAFVQLAADSAGVELVQLDITPILTSSGCYAAMDELARKVFSAYSAETHTMRTEFSQDLSSRDSLPLNELVIMSSGEEQARVEVSPSVLSSLLAATNMKQRVRMLMTYSLAERTAAFVLNTSNRLEHRTGFFVKFGDGAGDLAPLLNLYKHDVRNLAKALRLPEKVAERLATTDTYSAKQDQSLFYFGMTERLADGSLACIEADLSDEAFALYAKCSLIEAQNSVRLTRRRIAASNYQRDHFEFVERSY